MIVLASGLLIFYTCIGQLGTDDNGKLPVRVGPLLRSKTTRCCVFELRRALRSSNMKRSGIFERSRGKAIGPQGELEVAWPPNQNLKCEPIVS